MAHAAERESGWRSMLPHSLRAYFEAAPLAALFLGVSSGFPYAMIGATLTTRLKQDRIDRSTITAFTLAFLVYNLKPLWSWVVDGVRLPLLGILGQRVSWMLFVGTLVIAAVAGLGGCARLGTAGAGFVEQVVHRVRVTGVPARSSPGGGGP